MSDVGWPPPDAATRHEPRPPRRLRAPDIDAALLMRAALLFVVVTFVLLGLTGGIGWWIS